METFYLINCSQFVGKIIEYGSNDGKYLRGLGIIFCLRPSIVELLCCYSYQNLHIFLFPPIANHGDLKKLSEMPERSVQFNADEVLFFSSVWWGWPERWMRSIIWFPH